MATTALHSPPARDLFAAAMNALRVNIAILGPSGRIEAVNDAWRAFATANGAGNGEGALEGADYLAASRGCGDDPEGAVATAGVERVLDGELEEFLFEYPCHSPTEQRWFELRATPLSGGGAVVVHATITERKLAELQLAHFALHDELTGLANRRKVFQTLGHWRHRPGLGLLLIDLDRFKAVNDTYGHATGNDVLCAVAGALEAGGPDELAGRHGGDEFSVAIRDLTPATLPRAAARVHARITDRLSRLAFDHCVSPSVGATLVAGDEPLGEAFERADRALYAVKQGGRDGVAVELAPPGA